MNLLLKLRKKLLIKRFHSKPAFARFWQDIDLSQSIQETPFVVFDTETTGLDPKKAELVSIGALKILNLSIFLRYSFHQLVRPQKLTHASVEIHGITEQELREKGKPPQEVIETFLDFIKGCVLVGFNVEFDRKILEKYTRSFLDIPIPAYRLDVFSLWKRQGGEGKSLEEIAKELGIPTVGVHSALDDAYITALIFLKLVCRSKAQPVGSLPLML